jgi:hypothetical protein
VKRFASLIFLIALVCATAWGATVKFKNGTQISGTLVSETASSVVIRDGSGVERTFEKSDIQGIDFSDSGSAASDNAPSPSSNSAPAPSGKSMVVPSGTEISVRTNDIIDSTQAREGQSFSAVIANDVTGASGEVLIPKGADAELVLRQASSGGTTGSPELTLDLQSVSTGGHRYEVSSSDLQQGNNRGLGKNKRTATMVGGGAVLGTLLGAIAGGGKGAAIGAASGAAVGGTAQVLTKGKEVKVPAETVLNFKLDQPLHLDPTP